MKLNFGKRFALMRMLLTMKPSRLISRRLNLWSPARTARTMSRKSLSLQV